MKIQMHNKIICLIVVGLIATFVDSGTVEIPRSYKMSAYINQTATGYFRQVQGEKELARIPSRWLQDDLRQRLRVDVGEPGKPYSVSYWFFKDKSYELEYDDKAKSMKCKVFPDFNYVDEVGTYGYPNFGYVGRHTLQEFGGREADVYAGQALDGVGPLSGMFYLSTDGKLYLGLVITGTIGKVSFLEYWLGSNISSQIPPSSEFDLPSECLNSAQVENFFTKFNRDGTQRNACPAVSNTASSCVKPDSSATPFAIYKLICCKLGSQDTSIDTKKS